MLQIVRFITANTILSHPLCLSSCMFALEITSNGISCKHESTLVIVNMQIFSYSGEAILGSHENS